MMRKFLSLLSLALLSMSIYAQDGEITLVRGIDWHPTETVVAMAAFLDGRSGILIINMRDQSQQFVFMHNTALSVAWSPTGDRLAVVQGGTQYTAQILTWPGLIEQTAFPLAQSAQELSIFEVYWSPDGDQLASSQPYAIQVRVSATGRVINSLDMNRSNLDIILDVAWDSDGRTVYVLTQIGSVRLWDTVENEVIDEFRTLEFPTSMAISADGSYLAIGHSGNALQILDAITGEIITNLEIEGTTADVIWRPYTDQISTVGISADSEHSISTWDT